jgi:hypothetical protein
MIWAIFAFEPELTDVTHATNPEDSIKERKDPTVAAPALAGREEGQVRKELHLF